MIHTTRLVTDQVGHAPAPALTAAMDTPSRSAGIGVCCGCCRSTLMASVTLKRSSSRTTTGRSLLLRRAASRDPRREEDLHPRRQRLHRTPSVQAHRRDHRLGGLRHGHEDGSSERHAGSGPRSTSSKGTSRSISEWIAYHIKKCDVVVPLVAIATPATYVVDPLSVFELDFEANLPIIRPCVKYKQAGHVPVDVRSVRHEPGRGVRPRDSRRSCTGRSTSRAGFTPAPSSCWTGSSAAYGQPTTRVYALPARSTGSGQASTRSTQQRKEAPAS